MSHKRQNILTPLVAKDNIDYIIINDDDDKFDARLQFLQGTYQVSYQKIEVNTTYTHANTNSQTQKASYAFDTYVDFVNRIDLVLPNPDNLPLNKIIKSITTKVGEQQLDKIGSASESFDIETMIKTDCALFNRKLSHVNGKTFVPLNLAPMYNHNLMNTRIEDQEFIIDVEYTSDYNASGVELYGNVYILNNFDYKRTCMREYSFYTIQHQHARIEQLEYGKGAFLLGFQNPVYVMYFWGFDKTKVTNIRICINGHVFYNGSAEALEHYKLSRGYDVEPMMFFFSQDEFHKPTRCTVNFSKFDSVVLYIQSEQKEPCNVNIVGLSLQHVTFTPWEVVLSNPI